jgi:HAD superfamily phosphatase (TIGR01668 family)
MIEGIIFDLGSTLIHFDGDWKSVWPRSLAALEAALHESGVNWRTQDLLGEFAGRMEQYQRNRLGDHVEHTTRAVLEDALASVGIRGVDPDVITLALERMYSLTEQRWGPVPDLENTLDSLQQRGLRLGLLSNAADEANVQRLIDKVGIRSYFAPILISASTGLRKPAPDPFLRILKQWQHEPEQVVMVGDRLDQDILGAQRVGMHQIWLRSFAEPDQPDGIKPEKTADSLAQIPSLIDELSPKG